MDWTTERLTRVHNSILVVALLAAGYASAQVQSPATTVVVQPAGFFAKACIGQQVGVDRETGGTYRCSTGQWVREDVPLCVPDPPDGTCSGSAICQSPSRATLFLCENNNWRPLATVAGPSYSTDRAIARFDGTTGQRLTDSRASVSDQGDLAAASAVLLDPLGVASGGTGASTPDGARLAIGAAADASVVHRSGDEIVEGNKTLSGSTTTRSLNQARHSTAFPDIASTVADLPAEGGVAAVDAGEDDPIPFADTNPAGPLTGKKNSLVVDSRNGGIRFLSSMPEYPSGVSGALEDRVPFVFQVRLSDPDHLFDDEPGAIGAWNCGRDLPDGSYSHRNCPYESTSWGIQGGSKQYWHSGQCNLGRTTSGGSSDLCGGPHIFEVRYPEQPGVHESKPIFAVGNGGVSIYSPESHDLSWRGYLTMFRADDGNHEPSKANTPMFSFERYGAFLDGGVFVGATLAWPFHTEHFFPPFNLWVQHDIAPADPAFVVESSSNHGPEWEQGVVARIYDKTCCYGYEHRFGEPNSMREAFGFYANSVLRLASFTTTTSIDRGQYIEWEGLNVDADSTKLRVVEPTGQRNVYLPDQSGTVAIAPNSASMGPLFWGNATDGNAVCQSSGLTCQATFELKNNAAARPCDYAYAGYFMAMCRGSH